MPGGEHGVAPVLVEQNILGELVKDNYILSGYFLLYTCSRTTHQALPAIHTLYTFCTTSSTLYTSFTTCYTYTLYTSCTTYSTLFTSCTTCSTLYTSCTTYSTLYTSCTTCYTYTVHLLYYMLYTLTSSTACYTYIVYLLYYLIYGGYRVLFLVVHVGHRVVHLEDKAAVLPNKNKGSLR